MSTFRRLLGLVAPFRWAIAFGVLVSAATTAASVGLMAMSAYLISRAAITNAFADVAVIVTAVRFFALSRAALRYVERYINHRTTFRIVTHLRAWFYTAVEPLAPAGLLRQHSGDLLARIVGDIETLENFTLRVLIPPPAALLTTLVACAILAWFDWRLGVALLGFALLAGVVLPWGTRALSRRATLEAAAVRGQLSVALVDETQGLADLLANGRAEAQAAKVSGLAEQLAGLQQRLAWVRGLNIGLAALLTGLAGLAVLWLGIPLVTSGRIEGVFLAVLPLVAITCFEAIQPLTQSVQALDASLAAADRLFEIADAPPAVTDPPTPATAPSPAPQGFGIVAGDLAFRYGLDEPWVFEGLSLTIGNGEHVGIVGPNGAGKSSLANLLLRFWDYEGGSITVGGHELRSYRGDDLRAWIGVAPQHPYLFNTSIRDNLYVAAPEATEDALFDACRKAQVHDFILGLPQGYDTPVGDNGVQLSGGQRQLLSIARLLLKDAPLLILDEATSHLDAVTEQAVWQALGEYMTGRTALVITHRPAALAHVNRVIELPCAPGRR